MVLDVTAPHIRIVLKLTARRVERITKGNVDVFVGMLIARVAGDNNLVTRDLELNAYTIKIAMMMPFMR